MIDMIYISVLIMCSPKITQKVLTCLVNISILRCFILLGIYKLATVRTLADIPLCSTKRCPAARTLYGNDFHTGCIYRLIIHKLLFPKYGFRSYGIFVISSLLKYPSYVNFDISLAVC